MLQGSCLARVFLAAHSSLAWRAEAGRRRGGRHVGLEQHWHHVCTPLRCQECIQAQVWAAAPSVELQNTTHPDGVQRKLHGPPATHSHSTGLHDLHIHISINQP